MLSIVIPVFNQHSMTSDCIATLRETTTDYELILVDNGSEPPIQKPYMGFVDVTLIRNETNLGFPVAVNQACRVAKGDTIVLLNNDVFCTPHWGDILAGHLEQFAIVGPLTNYCAGAQRIVLPVYDDKEELYQIAGELNEQNAGKAIEVNWLIGFCFAFRRSLFDEIGEFDESMWPASGEEIDFALRARKAGHKVGIARDVYVHHEGSVTFRDMNDKGIVDYGELCEATTNNLKGKWGDFWNEQHIRAEEGKGLRINLGCGKFPIKGFINIDQQEAVKPDMVCDILDLPYDPGTVDEIYAGHVLEHFDWSDGENALRYWHDLLKLGGRISVAVPDFDVLAPRYVADMTPEKLRELNDTYIYSHKQVSPHQYAYSGALLEEVLTKAGFTDLVRMPVDHPYFPEAVDWQVGFSGIKP